MARGSLGGGSPESFGVFLEPGDACLGVGGEHDEVACCKGACVEHAGDRLDTGGVHGVLVGVKGYHACPGTSVGLGKAPTDEPETEHTHGERLRLARIALLDVLHVASLLSASCDRLSSAALALLVLCLRAPRYIARGCNCGADDANALHELAKLLRGERLGSI